MGTNTGIQWTDATWTPIRARNRQTGKVGWHCVKISDGCTECYSDDLNQRLGTGLHYNAGADVELFLDEKMLTWPLRWKKPRRIFVNSMSDLFYEAVPSDFIQEIWSTMRDSSRHTFQILTKRPGKMRDFVLGQRGYSHRPGEDKQFYPYTPLPNVWLGVSCEDQATADERIPLLIQTPAAVRFVSLEPLLGPISLDMVGGGHPDQPGIGGAWNFLTRERITGQPKLDWVIVGGESGRCARRCNENWIRNVIRACRGAGVPVFIKQLGSNAHHPGCAGPCCAPACYPPRRTADQIRPARLELHHPKGGDPEEWPADLRVREFPDG